MATIRIPLVLVVLLSFWLITYRSAIAGNAICIDPGHGGSDHGVLGPQGKIDEKDVNLIVGLALQDTLASDWPTSIVGLTRSSDTYVFNPDRADSANIGRNGLGYDYFISIHHNSVTSPCNDVQGTEAWHCMSDTVRGGDWRDVDSLMAYKIYLRIVEEWDTPNDPYVARGLKHSCGLTVLILNKRISVLTEASFLCNTDEEDLFADTSNTHAESEAGAIYRGFLSYCDGAGIAQVSNRFIGGDGGPVDIDYVPLTSPVNRTWAIFEEHNLYATDVMYFEPYWYYFHHWSHLRSDGTYLGPDYYERDWDIIVPAELDFHIYRAYFTGGPYWGEVQYLPNPVGKYAAGEIIPIYWNVDEGVDSTTVVDLYLDRNNGNDGYPELLAENIAFKDSSVAWWAVTGPDADSCKLKIVASDVAANQCDGFSQSDDIFSICSWLVGDADGSGSISMTDVVYIIDFIFGDGPYPTPHPVGSGDADGNFRVSNTDAVYIINWIMGGGPPPGQFVDCADY